MTRDELIEHIIEHTDTMYYVSYGILHHRADQEDAVQQTIEKAMIKIGSLRDASTVKAWLTRILVNECYNTIRKRKREFPSEIEDLTPPQNADEELFHAMMSIEEKLRLPIILHYQQGYTTKEVSMILRVPEGTVKGRLVRGRKMLCSLLLDNEVLA